MDQMTPERLAQIASEKQEYIQGRLRRWREDAELTQPKVAERLGVSQPAVAKWEREGTAPEEQLSKLWRLYGIRDSMPAAPKDPEKRKEYMVQRNAQVRRYSPGVKTIGAGIPPKGT